MPSVTRADTSRLLTVLALGSALWLSQGAVADGSPSAQIRTPEELEDYFNTHAPEPADDNTNTPEPADGDGEGDDDTDEEPEGSKAPADGEKPKRSRQPKPAATENDPPA